MTTGQQAELGRRQTELGLRQAGAPVSVPDFSQKMRQMQDALSALHTSETKTLWHTLRENLQRHKEMQVALKALDSSATQEELARAQAQLAATSQALESCVQQAMAQVRDELARMQSKLGALQAAAREKQAALGQQQAALGEQQAELGRQQAALARQQAKLARQASERLRRLIDQALKRGVTQPEPYGLSKLGPKAGPSSVNRRALLRDRGERQTENIGDKSGKFGALAGPQPPMTCSTAKHSRVAPAEEVIRSVLKAHLIAADDLAIALGSAYHDAWLDRNIWIWLAPRNPLCTSRNRRSFAGLGDPGVFNRRNGGIFKRLR